MDEGGRPPGTVVFFHAHPDDEAIFTGGTMALLARRGWRIVLVVATQGEKGETSPLVGPDVPLAVRRVAETARAAEGLGVERIEFLGYHDSGMAGATVEPPEAAFVRSSVDEAADRLGRILVEEHPRALVTYDERGVYGHPDHVQVHLVSLRAAERHGVPTVYEATVDREYLHFVETHLVVEASLASQRPERPSERGAGPERPSERGAGPERPSERGAGDLGLAASPLGLSTVEIDCTVDVRPVLEVKRRAMAAHASQIPESASALRLAEADFAAVYGFEWYARRGPAGPIDDLAT